MVENPIYAGPIYASVNDARGRLLLSEASTPSSVGTPEFPLPNRKAAYLSRHLFSTNHIIIETIENVYMHIVRPVM